MIKRLKRLVCRVFGHKPSILFVCVKDLSQIPLGHCLRCGVKMRTLK